MWQCIWPNLAWRGTWPRSSLDWETGTTDVRSWWSNSLLNIRNRAVCRSWNTRRFIFLLEGIPVITTFGSVICCQQAMWFVVSRLCQLLSAGFFSFYQQNLSVALSRLFQFLSAEFVSCCQQNLSVAVSRICQLMSADFVSCCQWTLSVAVTRLCPLLSAGSVGCCQQNLPVAVVLGNQDLWSEDQIFSLHFFIRILLWKLWDLVQCFFQYIDIRISNFCSETAGNRNTKKLGGSLWLILDESRSRSAASTCYA